MSTFWQESCEQNGWTKSTLDQLSGDYKRFLFRSRIFNTKDTMTCSARFFHGPYVSWEIFTLLRVCVCVCVHVCGHVYCVGMRVHVGLSLCTWLCVYFCPCECLSLSLLVCMCAAWAKSSKADIWPEEQRGKNCLIQIEPRTLNYDTNTSAATLPSQHL